MENNETYDLANKNINKVNNYKIPLSKLQQEIVNIIIEKPNITQVDIAKKLKVSRQSIAKNIKELKENDVIERVGANKEGYCYASNTYLGDLFNVVPHTISIWVSHLKNKGFLYVDIITDTRGEIIQRRMYPNDTPYVLNKTYPYVSNKTEGMSQKRQYNNININKIDGLFNYILNNKQEFPEEFSKVDFSKIYTLLDKYEMLYTNECIQYITRENLDKIKTITYIIALIAKDNLEHLTHKVSRNKLIKIYDDCKFKEEEYKNKNTPIENFTNYYYKSVTNELTKDNNSPSFFETKKEEEVEEL